MEKKLCSATVDKLNAAEKNALEQEGRANVFADELDSDGELLWKGIDLEEEAERRRLQQSGKEVEPKEETPLYLFYQNDGLINMANGDPSNALQSVLQVFLEIDDLADYFKKPTTESLNPFHVHMKKAFILAYRTINCEKRKPINLKHMMRHLDKKLVRCKDSYSNHLYTTKREYNAIDILKFLIQHLQDDFKYIKEMKENELKAAEKVEEAGWKKEIKKKMKAFIDENLPFEGGAVDYADFEGGKLAKVGSAPLAEESSGGSSSSSDDGAQGEMPQYAIEGDDAPASTLISKQFICEVDEQFTCAE